MLEVSHMKYGKNQLDIRIMTHTGLCRLSTCLAHRCLVGHALYEVRVGIIMPGSQESLAPISDLTLH